MAKSRKFSVRLLKSGINFKNACKEDANLKLISQDDIYSVYLATENSRSPWWKNYLGIDDDVFNSNNSAILTVNTKDRIFVYTFGFAHTKLKQDCFEENFGFFVTINSIDGEKIKSIDVYSPASNTKQKRVVSSILSNIYEYDFNDSQDLVQKLSGIIKEEFKDLFKNPTGTDSLSMYSNSSKTELKNISEKLLERFYSEDYKQDPYLKNINKISKATIQQTNELHNILIKKLNDRDFTDIYMADFEILDLDQFYSYKFGDKEFFDLCIENLKLEKNLTLEKLKTLKISVLKTQDDAHPIQWNLYKCLVFDHNNTFLSKGVVYEVKQDFLNEVNSVITKYKIKNFLPNALSKEKEGEKEGDYNARICDNQALFLLDKKCPNIEGHNKVEICDIYRKSGSEFIHIKKAESSSTLSHLWNQGIVSEQLANSGNTIFRETFSKETGIDFPEERKIYYGIIKKIENLPIFSRISLYNTIEILKGMGKKDEEIKYFYIGY